HRSSARWPRSLSAIGGAGGGAGATGGRRGAAFGRPSGSGGAAGVPAARPRRARPGPLGVTQEARPNPTHWAYAAGFVDGEGCIAITRGLSRRRGRYYYSVGVVVANRQREALDWLLSMWDGWVVQASSHP